MKNTSIPLVVTLILFSNNMIVAGDSQTVPDFEDVTVAAEDGKFFGWPANGGAWAWDDEIVVVFKQGNMDTEADGHLIDRNTPEIDVQARSLDGGKTWTLERNFQFDCKPEKIKTLTAPIDFTHPDFAFRFQLTGLGGGKSYFFYSYDRCKTWSGPYELPLFGEALVSARTCLLIDGKNEMRAFVSGAPKTGQEFGTHVFLIRTADGGLSWEKIADVGPLSHPDCWYIMPDVVRISEKELLCGIRFTDKKVWGNEYWGSVDDGKTWHFRSMLPIGGTPPSLEYFEDGDRLLVLYGQRNGKKKGVSARISRDRGRSWSDEIVIRDDGASFDLGYTRNVFRKDGKGVLIYYFTKGHPKADRTIEATIWDWDNFR